MLPGCLAGLILRETVLILSPGIFQLRSALHQNCFSLFQLSLAIGDFLSGAFQLRFPVCQFTLSVRQLLLFLLQSFFSVRQFFPSVGNLPLRVGKFSLPLLHLFSGIGKFSLRVRANLLISPLAGRIRDLFQPLLYRLCQIVILITVAERGLRSLHLHIGFRVDIQRKYLRLHQHKSVHVAVANGAAVPGQLHIIGQGAPPDNGVCIIIQGILQGILRAGADRDLIPDLKPQFRGGQHIHHTFIRCFRQAPLLQGHPVYILRQGNEFQNAFCIPGVAQHFLGISPGHTLHAFHLTHILQIRLGQSQSAQHPEIHQGRLIIITVRGVLHIIIRGTDSGVKGRSQKNYKKYRNKSS